MAGRVRALICGFLAAVMAGAALSGNAGTDLSRTFVARVSPDMAIVTEISVADPYVGEQFSVIYRLRTKHALAAVDIDPQQYPGFWTEAAPIDPQASANARASKDQGVIEYLLRQVILFPLMEGKQRVPPLSVKIRSARSAAAADDWDIVGSSTAVELNVMRVPPAPSGGAKLPMVGKISGTLVAAQENRYAVALDIEGSANLGMFQPLDWMRPPAGIKFHAHLGSANHITQTIEKEGKRQVALLERQHWLISIYGAAWGQRIEGFVLPVFDPHDKVWREVSIGGSALAISHNVLLSEERGGAADSGNSGTHVPRVWNSLTREVGILAGAAVALALACWLTARRRRTLKNPGVRIERI